MDFVIQLITAFIGSLGFALMWNVNGKCILPASFGGFMGWGVYLLLFNVAHMPIFSASFFAAAVVGLFAEICARVFKTPGTVFLIPSLIPLFPGSLLYYTVSAAAVSDWETMASQGLATVYFTLGIACGASIVPALFASFAEIRKKTQKNS